MNIRHYLSLQNTSHATQNKKQIARRVKITRVTREELEASKWKLTETIVYYSNEYATDITDIVSKTNSQEVPYPLLINRCTLLVDVKS